MKIFFNCLVYKDIDVVEDMINNINKFVKDPVIVMHVSPDFDNFDFSKFNLPNVFINTERFNHGQWGTKVKALISNKNLLINKYIDFDYEIIFYPKMLFIRHGIEDYLQNVDLCMPMPSDAKRDEMEYQLATKWNVFTEEEKRFFNQDIEKFLVEGMCFKRQLSDQVHYVIQNTNLYNKEGHCLEEFIFPTCAKKFASKIKHYPGIIEYNLLSLENIKKILNKEIKEFTSFFMDNQNVDDIYLVHKIDYGYNNEIREFVRSL